MFALLDWFPNNPNALPTLVSAGVAASVAFLVAVLTQFATSKREQTKILTGKLEELYLLLNKSSEDNVTRFDAVDKWFHGKQEEKAVIQKIEDLYGLNHNKKIIMLIRLYFPQLTIVHQQLFHTQRELNNLYYALLSGHPVDFEAFIEPSGELGHYLRLMESEVISNRRKLTSDYWFFCRYKLTPKKDRAYVHNPPQGPVSTRDDRASSVQDPDSERTF